MSFPSLSLHPTPLNRVTFAAMNIEQAKHIPIADYLSRAGFQPKRVRHSGTELWYHSPLRKGDDTPSFKVDARLNLWYDHGLADGGDIIKLVRELHSISVKEVLQHLERTGLYSPALASFQRGSPSSRGASRQTSSAVHRVEYGGEKEKNGAFELLKVRPLQHLALLQYLTKRKINHEVARRYASQIDFKAPGRGGNYFALGFPSGDGYEARNALFKGFVGTGKNVTFLDQPGASTLLVFEGFLDFFSYLTAARITESKHAVLVLNSTNLWRRALPYIQDPRFSKVKLYLDNDDAGSAATAELFSNAANAAKLEDLRSKYAPFEDLNAWLKDREG